MKEFLVMPEGCRWYTIKANTPNMAFASERCWFGIGQKIVIMDQETEQAFMYEVD